MAELTDEERREIDRMIKSQAEVGFFDDMILTIEEMAYQGRRNKNVGKYFSNKGQGYHSTPASVDFSNMRVKILPALKDNYMYLIIDDETNRAAAIDPVEPAKVVDAVKEENAILTTVLTTHHHWDHAGGNNKLKQLCPGIEILGGDNRIDGLTRMVGHNENVKIGNMTVQCLQTPCHTKGHICYFVPLDGQPPAVFTGDTLFTAGCGKFFEGSAEEMYESLIEVLSQLPNNTQVFCGHEYSVNNLKFAKHAEPDNVNIDKRLEWALKQREFKKPTVPSTIEEEKRTNPFMRVTTGEMKKIVGKSDPVSVMRILREMKDNF